MQLNSDSVPLACYHNVSVPSERPTWGSFQPGPSAVYHALDAPSIPIESARHRLMSPAGGMRAPVGATMAALAALLLLQGEGRRSTFMTSTRMFSDGGRGPGEGEGTIHSPSTPSAQAQAPSSQWHAPARCCELNSGASGGTGACSADLPPAASRRPPPLPPPPAARTTGTAGWLAGWLTGWLAGWARRRGRYRNGAPGGPLGGDEPQNEPGRSAVMRHAHTAVHPLLAAATIPSRMPSSPGVTLMNP